MPINTPNRVAGPFTSGDEFSFTFKVFDEADIVVKQVDDVGETSTLVLGTDYTVSLNSDQDTSPGGSVTRVAGDLPTDYSWTITTELEFIQTTQIPNLGAFFPQVITDAFDRLTMLIQQVNTKATNAVTLPVSDGSGLSGELPPKAQRLGKALVFDAVTGEPGVSAETFDDQGATAAAASAVAAAASEATAVASATAATTAASTATAAASDALAAVGAVKVSGDDTTAGNVEDKIVVGDGLTLSTLNDGANEQRQVDLNLGDGLTTSGGSLVADFASQAQAEAGTDNTTLMTPLRTLEAIAAQGLGGSLQTFQDVTASRAWGVTYTNTSGRPIMVFVAQSTSSGVSAGVNLYIDGQLAAVNGVGGSVTGSRGVNVMVQAGATYRADPYNGNTSAAYLTWKECR